MDLAQATEFAEKLHEIAGSSDAQTTILVNQRKLMEQIYKDLLVSVQKSFSGLFARMKYAHELLEVPESIQQQVNTLRTICNNVVHDEEKDIPAGAEVSGALCIWDLLNFLCPSLSYPAIPELLAQKNAVPFARRSASKKSTFTCLVESWNVQKQSGQNHALEISAITEDDAKITIILKDDPKENQRLAFTTLAASLWRFCTLNCMELSPVAGKDHTYINNTKTVVVLEPDFLIDASAIAECMSDDGSYPELYILGKLFSESSSEEMLRGQMVNSIFDELIHEPDQDYLQLFKKGLANMPIPMVALGLDSAKSIYNSVKDVHLPQISHVSQQMSSHDLLLEPSYLCPKYGLQGRLDLLYKAKNKFSIMELKSGKAHPVKIWPAHQYQVVAYNMIIRSAYGAGNLGSSSILYSADAKSTVRDVLNLAVMEHNLIHTRNRIVGILHLLSWEPKRFFDWLKKHSGEGYNPFAREKLQKFSYLQKNIQDYEYEWFCEQIRRIIREIWQVKTGDSSNDNSYGHSALWQQNLQEKSGKVLSSLKVLQQTGRSILLSFTDLMDVSDFRKGDVVILYDQSRQVDRQEIIRGVIVDLNEQQVELKVRGGVKNNRSFGEDSKWVIEHDILETFLYNPISSLTTFLEAPKAKRDLLLGLLPPIIQDNVPQGNTKLESILNRMQASTDLHIVQGPPGTGKTSGLLAEYIARFYHKTAKNMLVLSFTNRAVDEICLNLISRKIPFIRTGNSNVIKDQLLENLIFDKRFNDIDAIMRANRILVATVQSANAWYRDLLRLNSIDELIVDEASQILEHSLLGIMSISTKSILIGDQNQLPAISSQSAMDFQFEHPDLKKLCYGSINQSLMERLYRVYQSQNIDYAFDMLTSHYRMHRDIAALVAPYYHHQLKHALQQQESDLPATSISPALNHRLLWIDCPPSEFDYYDPLQVKLIKYLIKQYTEHSVVSEPASEIGVVAPFRLMIHAIKKSIGTDTITVDTVERFQGSERDIIICCLPLKKKKQIQGIQAISDSGEVDRKLNVAVSRAKKRLVMIGNIDLCRQSKHYLQMIEHFQTHGKVIKSSELITL